MTKANIYKIETFDMGKGWLMDIVTTNDTYESWIYRKDIGIKSMMFGLPKYQNTYEEMLELSKINYPEYTDDYMYDYA